MSTLRRRWIIGGASAAAALVAIIVGLWLGVPAAVRWGLETVAAREIGRPIEVGDIRFNPFTLQLDIRDVSVGGATGDAGTLLTLGEVHARLSSKSLWRLAPVVRSLRVQTVRVNIARLAPNRFNFSDIVERLAARPDDGEPARFAVNNIELHDGAIAIDDQVVGKKHTVSEIELGIPFISSLPDDEEIKVKPALSARVNQAQFNVDGETLPFADTLETSVAIRFTGLHLPTYLGYVPLPLQFSLPRGELDTDLRLAFRRAVAAAPERPAQPARVLLTGRAAIRDLALLPNDMQEPLAEWRLLEVDIDEVEPLARIAKIASATLTAPIVRATRRGDGTVAGLDALEASLATGSTTDAPKTEPFSVAVSQLRLVEGTVHVRDETVDFSRTLQSIAVEVDGFSTTAEAPAALALSARTDDDAQLKVTGELRPASRQVAVDATLESLRMAGLAPYLRLFTTAIVDGKLSAGATVRASQAGNELALEVADGRVTAADFRIEGPRGKRLLLSAPKIEITGIGVDLQKRAVDIGRASVTGARAQAGRQPDGSRFVDWEALIVERPPGAADQTPAWSMKLDQFELVDARLQAFDRAVEPATILDFDGLSASIRNLSSDLSSRMDVELRTRLGGGTAHARGWLRPQPAEAELTLDAANIDITPLRPYLAEYANAVLASASVSAAGTLSVKAARASPVIRYEGSARVTNFAALTPSTNAELARWRALALDSIRVDTGAEPPLLDIGAVKVDDFYARGILSAQGDLNLVEVFAPAAEAAPAQASAPKAATAAPAKAAAQSASTDKPPMRIRVGGIEFVRGRVNFTDNFVKPNYTANLTELAGTVGELSSDGANPADVAIRATGDLGSLIEITGKINPMVTPLVLDLRGSTKDVELTRLTPYSIKYAGYPITRGRLSMDVHYKIENRRLQAENHLFLEQLTFGDRVESPTAMNLPVHLAVSLLQNSRGEIDISLPISGSLDDPEFSIGALIGAAVAGLVKKIVTAPFAALSAAVGGDEDLGHVAFAPGSTRLDDAQLKRLESLAKALNDRPALRLNITGRALAATDAEALHRGKLDAKLRAAKARELSRGGRSVDPQSVTVAADERERLIGVVYEDEDIAGKPRNFLGMAKSIPPEQMEELLMGSIDVQDKDLRQLAEDRAGAVRDHLAEQGKVPGERLFLAAPLIDGSGDTKLLPSRVDFSLK